MSNILSVDRHSLQAPRNHREALLFPPPEDWDFLRQSNQSTLSAGIELQGKSLQTLHRLAQQELKTAAVSYCSAYTNVTQPDPASPVVLTGHQAELYHGGVWAKNFVLHRLGKLQNATAINLIVDSDLMKSTALRIPSGSTDNPTFDHVYFDKRSGDLPSEERCIQDWELFYSFPERVEQRLTAFVSDPLLRTLWPKVLERVKDSGNLGLAISQARHQIEREWGLETLELPLSQTCQFESFGWFAIALLARLPCLWAIYNQAIQNYRQKYRIRNPQHPFPELEEQDGWLEAPFWIWSQSDPRRRRLFAKQHDDQLLITDRHKIQERLSLTADSAGDRALAQFLELANRGIKIRTRALTTTMWARIVLGDLFVHGLGGAKYDEVTNQVIQKFLGLEPPSFITATATMRLPIPALEIQDQDLRTVDQELRALTWNPHRYLESQSYKQNPVIASSIEAKQNWIHAAISPENYKQRFREIRQINRTLQPFVQPRRRWLEEMRSRLVELQDAQRLAHSREFSYCLFAEDTLRDFLGHEVAGL